MSNEMRNLINLVEEAQINSYLDRLKVAETQEEYNSIISEAELYEAPGMVDKIKKGAMGLGLAGAMAMGGQAMADEPVSADPGADANAPQAQQIDQNHANQVQAKYPNAFGFQAMAYSRNSFGSNMSGQSAFARNDYTTITKNMPGIDKNLQNIILKDAKMHYDAVEKEVALYNNLLGQIEAEREKFGKPKRETENAAQKQGKILGQKGGDFEAYMLFFIRKNEQRLNRIVAGMDNPQQGAFGGNFGSPTGDGKTADAMVMATIEKLKNSQKSGR
tara:strand:- start:8693 stop:9517 length:825 start_codon:yes stop_codon:yes gene_type:complete